MDTTRDGPTDLDALRQGREEAEALAAALAGAAESAGKLDADELRELRSEVGALAVPLAAAVEKAEALAAALERAAKAGERIDARREVRTLACAEASPEDLAGAVASPEDLADPSGKVKPTTGAGAWPPPGRGEAGALPDDEDAGAPRPGGREPGDEGETT